MFARRSLRNFLIHYIYRMQDVKFTSIEDYITATPENVKSKLEEIRNIIKNAAPDTEEVISYGMPAFKRNGILVYFAGWKSHIGFYPAGSNMADFADELSKYKTSKGAIQFRLDESLPEKLIAKIVRFRIKENQEKAVLKALARKKKK